MRYVIYGAGAVGGVVGGLLHEAGRDVVLIARGAHLEAIRAKGLHLRQAGVERLIRVQVASDPTEAGVGSDDAILLTMKSQDTAAALVALPAEAQSAIFCLQNGVENERVAARRYASVYGAYVYVAGVHLEPGVVESESAPCPGIIDIGRFPAGIDERASEVAADLEAAGFSSQAVPDVMAGKHAKLIANLHNALEIICGREADVSSLRRDLEAEGRAVFDAAGITHTLSSEIARRHADLISIQGGDARRNTTGGRIGSSIWQSVARGAGSIEVDYINGEIVMLGRLHGIATPLNAAVVRLAHEVAEERRPIGERSVSELRTIAGER